MEMACAAQGELKGFRAREGAERRRLTDVLCDQLSRDLLRLLNEEIHTDLTLHVGQTTFKAHKAVLQARVPNFYNYITQRATEDTITVQHVEPTEIKGFLKIVYSSLWSTIEREDHILEIIKEKSVVDQDQNDDKCSNLQGYLPSTEENTDFAINKSPDQNTCSEENHNSEEGYYSDPPSDLGKDLLSLFRSSRCTDVIIQIEDKCFHAHRAILCARSSYFAAMLSGCWVETSQDLIQIHNVKQADMMVIMHFIYGGIMDLPKSTNAGQILSIADMYGMEGLKDVAVYVLKRDYCKFFIKPVFGMQQSVLECLAIAYSVGEEPLYTSCMRWMEKYFVKCWSERSFASLPVDLQNSCLSALVQSLSCRNAAFLLMESDRLLSSLPEVKWTERVRSLASDLQDECVRFIVANFSQTIRSESFVHLLQDQGMSSRPYLLEHIFNEIEKSISFENCSSLYMAVEMLKLTMENEMVFTCKIQALRDKLWSFLVQSFYAVRHTEGWKLMRPGDQDTIQAATFDKGDDRRLAKKPTFTSSQQNRPKIVKSKEQSAESKRYSDSNLPDRRKMKSDSLGASGHTTNSSRSSSGKAKDDDVKGKDVKKVTSKLSKDPKQVEKTTTTRAKLIVKTKSENNDIAKTEGCASKGDFASNQKPESGRTGARPKATNGSVNPIPKVKSLKKTGEQNADRSADKQQNSTTGSPQFNKMLKTNPDCSKEISAAAKSKPAAKISNGVSAKKKVNEADCREPSSTSTKKVPTEGGNDSGLQKRKVIKMGTMVQQRPKSAPAALSKKQVVTGDTLDLPKSVSSKQSDVKMEAKLVNHSNTGDKHASVNKKATKPSVTSANKMHAAIPSNKHSLSSSKSSLSNHKESKPKVQNGSKPLSLNQKSYQKSSSLAVKKSHNLATNNTENPMSVADEVKQSASHQLVEKAENIVQHCQPFSAHESCQEISMSNQDPMIQKPNLEHCQCQENLPTASAFHYASNSKEGLAEATNQTKTANVDNAGSGEVYIISTTGEKKPDCKNICDSENSKCADSSSESELCSVKEVERIPKQKEREDMTLSQNTNRFTPSYNAAESPSLGSTTSCRPVLNNSVHFMNCSSERQLSDYQTEMNTTEAVDHENFEFIGQWNKHSGMLHERESPESESGSASTSSDDIKPRSEDYDAGGSQDDDGSNERGISKCSTMRCHDFLGRSSSDTSTPEELKGYDGSLRVDVKMKKDHTELFRVNSTSDDEGPQKRMEPWLQRDIPKHSSHHITVCSSVQFSQEIEHLSSSADETEDERSETESTGLKVPEETAPQPFQGIVNLAFDDIPEMEGDPQEAANKSFKRSVLLSVDECEELGSDEGDAHSSQMRKPSSLTPSDVFERNGTENASECSHNHDSSSADGKAECASLTGNQAAFEKKFMADGNFEESDACKGYYKSTECEIKSQTRPCHLDLYTESPSDAQRFCCTKTGNACKSQFLDYQGRDNHVPSTESSNTALSAGHIDDNESLAQICMYDHRPPKSLSPIYEMDPGEGIEQRLKTEARILDIEIEDQQFVERDWTLLKQLLADHGSDVDIINSVPEDLSLAQYLINQTLLLARENSKSQGKAWGDLSSPFEDSTSITVTSYSPDECSSPHGEWTILELETHH
ncbi:BTB/POZ domain-containing protein 8 isoform 3-T3 [Mantella aurantiaca]